MTFVIGIDGGGTKTQISIADIQGNVLQTISTGATNPNTESYEKALSYLISTFQLLKEHHSEAFHQLSSVFLGMSGYGNQAVKERLKIDLSKILPPDCMIGIHEDGINGLYSGTYGDAGIVQVAGTGSITYAYHPNHGIKRIGGHGFLLGDHGSGFEIGKMGVQAVLDYTDGKTEATVLESFLLKHFRTSDPLEMVALIYNSTIPKNTIAETAIYVFQAYKQGDHQAARIIDYAARKISEDLIAASTFFVQDETRHKVVLCGSIFKESDIMISHLKKYLPATTLFDFILPVVPPVAGSVIGAIKMTDTEISKEIIGNINHSF